MVRSILVRSAAGMLTAHVLRRMSVDSWWHVRIWSPELFFRFDERNFKRRLRDFAFFPIIKAQRQLRLASSRLVRDRNVFGLVAAQVPVGQGNPEADR